MSNTFECLDLSCFDEIIGLSETACNCLPENIWYNSKSCLYLDKAEGMNLRQILSLEACETNTNLWLLMNDARDKAIKKFVADTQALMAEKYDQRFTHFNGYIGKNSSKYLATSSYTYAGMRIRPRQVVGGYFNISQINTIFEKTGAITLYIYNSLNELLYTINLNTLAGKLCVNTLSTNILLPLWDGRTETIEYVFVYQYDTNNRPYKNMLSCCGKTYCFDCSNPYYNKSNKLEGWANYLMAGSIQVNTLDFESLSCTTDDNTNGLQLYGKLYCDTTKQFCFEEQDITNIQYLQTAYAILHKAAEYLAIDLITSDKINRYTMTNIETMEAVRALHEKKYIEALEKLINGNDLKNTDCFLCKPKYNIRRALL